MWDTYWHCCLRRDANGGDAGARKRKPVEELAYDVMLHFSATVRSFYMAVAKSVHTTVRRRDEATAVPTLGMQAAAVHLVVLLRKNLENTVFQVGPEHPHPPTLFNVLQAGSAYVYNLFAVARQAR